VAWAEVYFHTKWCLHPSSRFATIDMNQKLGAVPLLRGNCDPIQHNVAWAEVYCHTKWHLDPSNRLATIDMAQKYGGRLCPFSGRSSVPIEHKVV